MLLLSQESCFWMEACAWRGVVIILLSYLVPTLHMMFYVTAIIVKTRGGPCQHGFMCGCRQWSNDINESN